jgi:hypothetical protein
MKCPMCSKLVEWQNDLDYNDFGVEGDMDGIVGIYTCYNEKCDVEDIHIFTPLNNDDE